MCTYLRAVSTSGEVYCTLVMGRSRVPPSKVTTIPRLELSAAVVAVRTGDMLKKEFEIEISEERYWTDSKVVLGYISNEARRFHVFVANRVERIKQGTESTQWWYVTSKDNPADHASRGLTAEQLVASNWFKGPDLLWQKVITSSVLKVGELSNSDPEVRKVQVHTIQVEEQRSLLDRLQKFSDWLRMIKAVARLKRYVKEAKDHKKSCNIFNLQERKEAEVTIIKMVQAAVFTQEIKTLQHHEVMQTKNRVSKFQHFSTTKAFFG